MNPHLKLDEPSPWVMRFSSLIPKGEVLDLACGSGRHSRPLAALGYAVLAVDRDPAALEQAKGAGIVPLHFDLEAAGADGLPSWPLHAARFAGIVVTNYLHRPLMPALLRSLAPGGVLIYETFMSGNERFGKPSSPAFLLRPGELLELAQSGGFEPYVVAFEQGRVERPRPAAVQRICLNRPRPHGDESSGGSESREAGMAADPDPPPFPI